MKSIKWLFLCASIALLLGGCATKKPSNNSTLVSREEVVFSSSKVVVVDNSFYHSNSKLLPDGNYQKFDEKSTTVFVNKVIEEIAVVVKSDNTVGSTVTVYLDSAVIMFTSNSVAPFVPIFGPMITLSSEENGLSYLSGRIEIEREGKVVSSAPFTLKTEVTQKFSGLFDEITNKTLIAIQKEIISVANKYLYESVVRS